MMGWNHFKRFEGLKSYAASKNVLLPGPAVIVSGAMILLGGLGIILGVYPQFSALLISLFLLVISFKMHNFWTIKDPNMAQQRMIEMTNFMKNIALLGAALMFLMIEDWPLSLF